MKRIGKEPDARDMGLKLINDAMKQLIEMKTLANTDEFLNIANAIHSFSPYDSTPSLGEKKFIWSLYLSGLERWTDPKYTGALELLRGLTPDEDTMNEYKDSYCRIHSFKWEFEDGYELTVSMCCYEKSDTAECRKVQVGTKMVEQPIYRYDCVVPEGNAGELPAPILELENLV